MLINNRTHIITLLRCSPIITSTFITTNDKIIKPFLSHFNLNKNHAHINNTNKSKLYLINAAPKYDHKSFSTNTNSNNNGNINRDGEFTITNQTNLSDPSLFNYASKVRSLKIYRFEDIRQIIANFIIGTSKLYNNYQQYKIVKSKKHLNYYEHNIKYSTPKDLIKAIPLLILFAPPVIGYFAPIISNLISPYYLPTTYLTYSQVNYIVRNNADNNAKHTINFDEILTCYYESSKIRAKLTTEYENRFGSLLSKCSVDYTNKSTLLTVLKRYNQYSIFNHLHKKRKLIHKLYNHLTYLQKSDAILREDHFPNNFNDLSIAELLDANIQRGLFDFYYNTNYYYYQYIALENNPNKILDPQTERRLKALELQLLSSYNYNLDLFPLRKQLITSLTNWINKTQTLQQQSKQVSEH